MDVQKYCHIFLINFFLVVNLLGQDDYSLIMMPAVESIRNHVEPVAIMLDNYEIVADRSVDLPSDTLGLVCVCAYHSLKNTMRSYSIPQGLRSNTMHVVSVKDQLSVEIIWRITYGEPEQAVTCNTRIEYDNF